MSKFGSSGFSVKEYSPRRIQRGCAATEREFSPRRHEGHEGRIFAQRRVGCACAPFKDHHGGPRTAAPQPKGDSPPSGKGTVPFLRPKNLRTLRKLLGIVLRRARRKEDLAAKSARDLGFRSVGQPSCVHLTSITEGTKFWFTNIRTLRVLRDLRGE